MIKKEIGLREDEKIYSQYIYNYPHKTSYRSLDIDIRNYLPKIYGRDNTLYIHIPFCDTKCGFCNLFSVNTYDRAYITRYIDMIEKQAWDYGIQLREDVSFNSIIFGGGTPLILSASEIKRIVDISKEYLNLVEDPFIGVETTPEEATFEKLEELKKLGVNRVSIGIQSLEVEELKKIGRRFDVDLCKKALGNISKLDFDIFNSDIIYGIPGQDENSLKNIIDTFIENNVNEIFLYPLYIRKGTPLYKGQEVDEEWMYSLYIFARDYLEEKGFTQKSMRRFSKDSSEPIVSCGFTSTLSLGAGGRSYIGNLHFSFKYSTDKKRIKSIIDEYLEREDFYSGYVGALLDLEELKIEFLLRNLFQIGGLSKKDYKFKFSSEVVEDFPKLEELKEKGYLVEGEEKYKLTKLGISLGDYLGPKFISRETLSRMKSYEDR